MHAARHSGSRIETDRLVLSPVAPTDVDALHRLWTSEPVRRYLWDGKTVPREQTREIVAESERLFDRRGFGIWGIRQPDGVLAGFVGYWYFRDPPELELLVGLAPDRWGSGIATEASAATIRYALDRLGFTEIRASTDAANEDAVALVGRLGMQLVRRATVDGLDTLFYVLRRSAEGGPEDGEEKRSSASGVEADP